MSFLEELGNVNKVLDRLDRGAKAVGRLTGDSAKTAAQVGRWGTMSDTEDARIERANRRVHGDVNRAGTYEEMTGRQYYAVRNGAEPIRNPYGFRYNPQQTPPYQSPGTVYPAESPASPRRSQGQMIEDAARGIELIQLSPNLPDDARADAAAEVVKKLGELAGGEKPSIIKVDKELTVSLTQAGFLGPKQIKISAGLYTPELLAQALEDQIGVDPKVKAALDAQFAKTAAAPARSDPTPAAPAKLAAEPAPTAAPEQPAAPAKVETVYHIEGLPAVEGHPAKLYAGKDGAKVDPQEAPTIDQAQVAKIQEMLGAKVDGKWGPETQAKFAAQCKEAGVNPHDVDFTKPNGKELIALMGKLKPEMLVADKGKDNSHKPEKIEDRTSLPPAQAVAAPSVTFPSPTATDLGLAQHGVTTPAKPLTEFAATPVAVEPPPSFLTALGISGVTPALQGVYTGNVPLPPSPSSVEVVGSTDARPRRGGIDADGHMYGGAVSPLPDPGIAHAAATLSGFPSYVIDGVTVQARGFNPTGAAVPSSPAPDTAALDARVGQYAKEVGLVANTGGGNALFTAAAPAFADTASQAQALAASVSAPAVAAPAVAVARGVEAAAPEALAAYFEPPPQSLPNLKGASQGMGGIV